MWTAQCAWWTSSLVNEASKISVISLSPGVPMMIISACSESANSAMRRPALPCPPTTRSR